MSESELDTNIKVLVVDDFATMRKIIKNILGQLGIEQIDEADDGFTAVPKLASKKYDIALVDWNMPKMNGLDLIKHIRSNDDTKSLPIIMVTAEALKDNIVAATQAGVNDYIVKPFTADVLEKKLKKVLNK